MSFEPELRRSIVETLSYFNLFNQPLTKEELFGYLWEPPKITYEDYISLLPVIKQSGIVEEKFGFYFLPDKAKTVEDRRAKDLISDLKIKKAVRAIKKIKCVPFLRAVLVCNSVGAGQAGEDSDIDFLIIAAPNRVWIVRLFTNLILRLFGLRTYGQKIKDRICLSFYLDEKHLNLADLRVEARDVHFAYWLRQMVPLFDRNNLYKRFLSANQWTEHYLPYSQFDGVCLKSLPADKLSTSWRKIWERMWQGAYGDVIEKEAKEWQMLKMSLAVKNKMNNGDKGVVIKDGVIKLHENDTRKKYLVEWKLCLAKRY